MSRAPICTVAVSLLFITLLISALVWAARAIHSFGAQHDLTIPEGAIVYSLRAVWGPTDVYRDYSRPPYATTPYPPLYYLLSGTVAKALGPDVDSSYRAGRLVTALSLVIALAMVYLSIRSRTRSLAAALVSVASATTLSFAFVWSISCRPDVLALALSLTGLRIFATRVRMSEAMALAAFAMAVMSKQSFLAAPLSVAAWLYMHHKRAECMRFCIILACVVGISCALLQWYSRGLFINNVVLANVAPLVLSQPLRLGAKFAIDGAIPLSLAVMGALLRKGGGRRHTLDELYFSSSLAIALVTSLKVGADMNYFIEPGFAVTLLAGRAWPQVRRWLARGKAKAIVGFLAILFACEGYYFRVNWGALEMQKNERDARFRTFVDEMGPQVLIGDAGVAMRAGGRIWLLDKFNASYLCDAGVIDLHEVVRMIEKEEFTGVVSDVDLDASVEGYLWWPKPVAVAIHRHYPKEEIHEGYRIFLPMPQ
jgi:hypothetical protein